MLHFRIISLKLVGNYSCLIEMSCTVKNHYTRTFIPVEQLVYTVLLVRFICVLVPTTSVQQFVKIPVCVIVLY